MTLRLVRSFAQLGYPGIRPSRRGVCFRPGCGKRRTDPEERGYCRECRAWREIQCREKPAEVLRMGDYERDPETGFLWRTRG